MSGPADLLDRLTDTADYIGSRTLLTGTPALLREAAAEIERLREDQKTSFMLFWSLVRQQGGTATIQLSTVSNFNSGLSMIETHPAANGLGEVVHAR